MLIASVHRETEAPVVLADEEIEHWARIYVRLDLLSRGYTFEDFLRATPQVRADAEHDAALVLAELRRQQQRGAQARGDREAKEPYSVAARLTPRDHQALKKLYAGFSARGNGARLEKLRHKRWPRGRRSFVKAES